MCLDAEGPRGVRLRGYPGRVPTTTLLWAQASHEQEQAKLKHYGVDGVAAENVPIPYLESGNLPPDIFEPLILDNTCVVSWAMARLCSPNRSVTTEPNICLGRHVHADDAVVGHASRLHPRARRAGFAARSDADRDDEGRVRRLKRARSGRPGAGAAPVRAPTPPEALDRTVRHARH